MTIDYDYDSSGDDDDEHETIYSSTDEDYYYCYYCETNLDYEDKVYVDLEPCKKRYYCSRCKIHIHSDDLHSE